MAKIDTREIQIPSILKVEKDLLRRIGGYLADEGIYKVVILFGNGLIDMFGHTVMEGMSDSGVEVLQYMEMDTVRIDDLVQLAFSFPNTAQAVLGIGGGKVVDAAKYCGFLRKLPFISVPTSASSDGFRTDCTACRRSSSLHSGCRFSSFSISFADFAVSSAVAVGFSTTITMRGIIKLDISNEPPTAKPASMPTASLYLYGFA